MASVWAEIELDDVRTSDLLEELENRWLQPYEHRRLLEILKDTDKEKLELFMKIKDKYSLLELSEMFQEPAARPSKEQLKFEFQK